MCFEAFDFVFWSCAWCAIDNYRWLRHHEAKAVHLSSNRSRQFWPFASSSLLHRTVHVYNIRCVRPCLELTGLIDLRNGSSVGKAVGKLFEWNHIIRDNVNLSFGKEILSFLNGIISFSNETTSFYKWNYTVFKWDPFIFKWNHIIFKWSYAICK